MQVVEEELLDNIPAQLLGKWDTMEIVIDGNAYQTADELSSENLNAGGWFDLTETGFSEINCEIPVEAKTQKDEQQLDEAIAVIDTHPSLDSQMICEVIASYDQQVTDSQIICDQVIEPYVTDANICQEAQDSSIICEEVIASGNQQNLEEYQDPLIKNKLICDEIMASINQQSIDNPLGLDLEAFDVNPRTYIAFCEQFKVIDENTSISSKAKFRYLMATLKENTNARKIVEKYSYTPKNYRRALNELKAKFGKESSIIRVYTNDLLSLVLNKKARSLKSLYFEISSKIRGLELLGVTTENVSAVLYPLVRGALPADISKRWQKDRDGTDQTLCSSDALLRDLLAFIEIEVEADEFLFPPEGSEPPVKETGPESEWMVNKELSCAYCEGKHDSQQCEAAKKIKTEEFTCKLCQKVFDNKLKYQSHVRRTHAEKKISCSTCGKKFAFAHKLKLHESSHSDIAEYLCATCGKPFKRLDKLRLHVKKSHSEGKSFQAQPLRRKIVRKNIVKPERMTKAQLENYCYRCDKCWLGFNRRGVLINHMIKMHPEIPISDIAVLAEPVLKVQKSFKCHYCEKVYMSNGKRKAHIRKKHPDAVLPAASRFLDTDELGTMEVSPKSCAHCPKQFMLNGKLLQHIRKEHPLVFSRKEIV